MTVDINRRYLLTLIGVGMVSGLISACTGSRDAGLAPGSRFPDVTLQDFTGKPVLLSTFSGSALLLNFWASWCEPCRHEMDSLQRLSRLFRAKDLQVVGITVDRDINLAREFVLGNALTFPMLSDAEMQLSDKVLGIRGFPTTYLLARDMTVAQIVTGGRDWMEPELVSRLERLLNVSRIHHV